jgi:16S rRNA (uracil1498-N3)-methyltransferase
VVERRHHPVATFVADATPQVGQRASLGESAAHHARVRRLAAGDHVRLTDGAGVLGEGRIERLAKRELQVLVERVESRPRPRAIELLVPVGDRDRMLWLAEKATELAVTVWQPVIYARSRSVTPRGEGESFREKVRLRMEAALEQSSGAWLPEIRAEITAGDAVRHPAQARIVLDAGGDPLLRMTMTAPVALAFGPEGGFEPEELDAFLDAGWRAAAVGPSTLRFETAGIAAVAAVRAALDLNTEE